MINAPESASDCYVDALRFILMFVVVKRRWNKQRSYVYYCRLIVARTAAKYTSGSYMVFFHGRVMARK